MTANRASILKHVKDSVRVGKGITANGVQIIDIEASWCADDRANYQDAIKEGGKRTQ